MTMWKNINWDKEFKERLGDAVFQYIQKDQRLVDYLSDYKYVRDSLKQQGKDWQLSDNSLLVLHICKFFEGVLHLVTKDLIPGQYPHPQPESIRGFILSNRGNIEKVIDRYVILDSTGKQEIKDRLFALVQDFRDRNEAMHYGSFLKLGELDNYDAILTKIRDVIKPLLDNGFIRK